MLSSIFVEASQAVPSGITPETFLQWFFQNFFPDTFLEFFQRLSQGVFFRDYFQLYFLAFLQEYLKNRIMEFLQSTVLFFRHFLIDSLEKIHYLRIFCKSFHGFFFRKSSRIFCTKILLGIPLEFLKGFLQVFSRDYTSKHYFNEIASRNFQKKFLKSPEVSPGISWENYLGNPWNISPAF